VHIHKQHAHIHIHHTQELADAGASGVVGGLTAQELADAVAKRKRAEEMVEGAQKDAALKAAREREEKAREAVAGAAVSGVAGGLTAQELADAVAERKRAEEMTEGAQKDAALKAAREREEKAREAVAGAHTTLRDHR